MIISFKKFKNNVDEYLEKASEEDIFITNNGRIIAKLSNPQSKKINALRSLVGIARSDSNISLEEIRDERVRLK